MLITALNHLSPFLVNKSVFFGRQQQDTLTPLTPVLAPGQPSADVFTPIKLSSMPGASTQPMMGTEPLPENSLPVFAHNGQTVQNIGIAHAAKGDTMHVMTTKGGHAIRLDCPSEKTTYFVFPGGKVQTKSGSYIKLWAQDLNPMDAVCDSIHKRPAPQPQDITDQALIAAGGDSSRFMPLTTVNSKVVVPTSRCGNTLVGRSAKMLRDIGVNTLWVTVRAQANKVKLALKDIEKQGLHINYFQEKDAKGDIGALIEMLQNPKKWGIDTTKPLLIVNGDSYSNIDYTDLLQKHVDNNALLTMGSLLVPDNQTKYFGISVTDQSDEDGQSGQVVGFKEKPDPSETSSRLANTANIVLSPQALKLLPQIWEQLGKPAKVNLSNDIIPELIKRSQNGAITNPQGQALTVRAQAVKGQWVDVGRPPVYFQIHQEKTKDGAIVWPGAKIDTDTIVKGNVVVSQLVA
jgi:NDP-sugar pyrophosphorylase family protein